MLYAALTFWLVVIVLTAWGVLTIWSGLLRPRVVNAALLPGTLIAQIGHVVGLLLTGAEINKTQLVKDDESGEPATAPDPKPRIPIIGPILIAMLPLIACGGGLYLVSRNGSAPETIRRAEFPVAAALPKTMAAFWQLLRDCISLVETLVGRLRACDWTAWQTWTFFYLVICLTVRMAPLPGNLRGAIGAILLLGVLAAIVGGTWPAGRDLIVNSWPVLSFSVACLLLMLLFSLAVRGAVGFFQLLYRRA